MIFVKSMMGLGDNIYQRSFLSSFNCDVYITTPWPELYVDLKHVKPVLPVTGLRTQKKNIQRYHNWNSAPRLSNQIQIRYGSDGIYNGMKRAFNCHPKKMSLPHFSCSKPGKKYIVVRPVTVRKEWAAESRNPLPHYVNEAAKAASDAGYHVISIADISPGDEWLVGDAPYCDESYHNGELSVKDLMSLVDGAAGVIGGIGWLLPASMAYGKRALMICGGQGGYNHPSKLVNGFEHDGMIKFAMPDNYCNCTMKSHNCSKHISDFEHTLNEWISTL